jgi:DNA-binding transcriptional regulator YdaS (Cro superfamily)
VSEAPEDGVAAYKLWLRRLIERRPSGTRRRLAAAMGAHPSFVSQIINPALRVPLPAQHLPAVTRVLHLSAEERAEFLTLYAEAHPAQAAALDALAQPDGDAVRIAMPPGLGAEARETAEGLIRDFAERVIALALHGETEARKRRTRREGRTR